MEASARAKFYFYNSMVCLLKAIERKRVRVEIRNGVVIEGILDVVEPTMALNMTEVTLTPVKGAPVKYTKFYVKGRQIRYVIIPDEVDIVKAMDWQVNKVEYFKAKERTDRRKVFDRRMQSRQRSSAKHAMAEQIANMKKK